MLACPHRPLCGACGLLDLPLSEQLELKKRKVASALARFPALARAEIRACRPAPSSVGYRTRVKLAVEPAPGTNRARIGLYAPGTHRVVDIPGCLVVPPELLPCVEELRRLLATSDPKVPHVDLRWSRATSSIHVTLVAAGPAAQGHFRKLAEELMSVRPEVIGVGLRVAPRAPVSRALAGVTDNLAGEAFIEERIGELSFRLSPGAFFQVNPAAAELLHELVRTWLLDTAEGPVKGVADLYAGVGAFAVALAREAGPVTAVESVLTAADDAVASAMRNGVAVRVVQAPAEDVAAELEADRIVLDPPRRGVPRSVLSAIGRAAPARVAYVSCEPDSLARDLDVLAVLGLATHAVVPVDMFPLTEHVESVALLERAPWKPEILWREGDAMAVYKPACLPTHPQEPGEPSLLAAARAATGLADLQPAHRLDVGTSGPVLLARGEALRNLGRLFETRAMIKEYLALVRGVPHKAGRVGGRGDEVTRYKREAVKGGYGLVRCFPETGRRHQIRRHLASIGHPILGDERYGDARTNRFLAETCLLARPFLHLAVLAFEGPHGPVRIECPLAPELVLALDRLEALRAGSDAPDRME
ncbi:MAG: 23S rRNA (uracil(1939)-C(5))-methyltransferase RlmD [Deltaproteobacteria bacterium]|nr:23S rRNA (uracil(1939)-C(5))-methyltransferase RlmD [Deltaproteobacteria bacterium]